MASRDQEAHDAERAMWVGLVATGKTRCRTCREPIRSDQPWDITARGLEHAPCPEE